jgi:ankyrin repeat protein
MWSFPRLPRPSIFIAAPGDLKHLRELAVREIDGLRTAAADDHGLGIYNWIVDRAKDGFEDWTPAQGQIPRPDDPLCRAVISMFGEKLGRPLSSDFAVHALPCLAGLDLGGPGGPRLVHDPSLVGDDPDAFPLTGSSFECLAALAAHQRSDAAHRPPVLILFVGDQSLTSEPDPRNANWGNGRLYAAAEKNFGTRRGDRESWVRDSYNPQIFQLRAFLRFLEQKRGAVPRFVADEAAARAQIRGFLERELGLVAQAGADPFKGLAAYGEPDAQVFFGRREERIQAVSKLQSLFEDAGRPTAYGIAGGSGAGKSSFLRAGLLGHLTDTVSDGYFVSCVMTPGELLANADGPGAAPGRSAAARVLCTLYLRALARVDPRADLAKAGRELVALHEDLQPAKALESLIGALDEKGEEKEDLWRLLIGLDQFEEVVDQRLDAKARSTWDLLLSFLDAAARCGGRAAVVYTLQTNRVEIAMKDAIVGPLWGRGDQDFLSFPDHSLKEIITRSFAVLDVDLEPALVAAFHKRIVDFSAAADPTTQGSLLPLVSLTLHNLRDAADKARSEAASETLVGSEAVAPPERTILKLKGFEKFLDVGEAVATLADEATREAAEAAGPDWSKETVGELLRRLVRAQDPEGDRFTLPLARLPAKGALRSLADALVPRRLLIPEPGGRHRLVHEAVCRHWPEAAAWLKEERSVLQVASLVVGRASHWRRKGRSNSVLLDASLRDLDEAAEVLAAWVHVLVSDDLQPDDALIREYGLALLAALPHPDRRVEASKRGPPHVVLAARYGQLDLIRRFIKDAPSCVHAKGADGRTAVFAACSFGHGAIVKALLDAHASPDEPDEKGWRPVHAASFSGHEDCLRELARRGAVLDALGPGDTSALSQATGEGHEGVVRLLIDLKVRVDQRDKDGWHPLHTAAGLGHAGIVQALLDAGADADVRRADTWTPLHAATHFGQVEAARALLRRAAPDPLATYAWPYDAASRLGSPTDAVASPLTIACFLGHAELVRLLLAHEADPTVDPFAGRTIEAATEWPTKRVALRAKRWTLLHLAADRGHAGVARALVEHRIPVDVPNADGITPLALAIRGDRDEVVKELVALGAALDRPAQQASYLLSAAANGSLRALQFLWNAADGALQKDTEGEGDTALHVAVRNRNREVVQWLSRNGAPLDAANVPGLTPLLLAVDTNFVQGIVALLRAGADAACRDARGRTPLHHAATRNSEEAVARLLEHPHAVDDIDDAGLTPLHLAASLGHSTVADALIGDGASVQARDGAGWTPLHFVARANRGEMVATLFNAGALLDARSTSPPRMPLEVALEVEAQGAVAALRKAGAPGAWRPRPFVRRPPIAGAFGTTRLAPGGSRLRSAFAMDDALERRSLKESPDDCVRRVVRVRDDHTCQACGFRAENYQDVVCTADNARDLDDLSTLCSFCAQCFKLDLVNVMQSGRLAHIPEASHAELHLAVREALLGRIASGSVATAARRLLELLLERSEEAKRRLGTNDTAVLARWLEQAAGTNEQVALARTLEGIRLVPNDRRIVRTSGLEYNECPAMLAYWRGLKGPYADWRTRGFPRVEAMLGRLGAA